MQFALLIYENEAVYGAGKDNDVFREIVAKHMAFTKDLGPSRVGGAGLKASATATTLRSSAGAGAGAGARTVHDGPFAEGKEQLGGFYIVDAPDLDAAIAIARKLPLVPGGSVEIRPVLGGPPPA